MLEQPIVGEPVVVVTRDVTSHVVVHLSIYLLTGYLMKHSSPKHSGAVSFISLFF